MLFLRAAFGSLLLPDRHMQYFAAYGQALMLYVLVSNYHTVRIFSSLYAFPGILPGVACGQEMNLPCV